MTKLKNVKDLRKLHENLTSASVHKDEVKNAEDIVKVKVAMATCSIASGSKEVLNFIIDELGKRNIDAWVTQTGCMGYCYAEPTIEITLPGRKPIVFGYVNMKKADEIIERYVKNGELVEGIIPLNYESVNY